jgi:hypothetical protein
MVVAFIDRICHFAVGSVPLTGYSLVASGSPREFAEFRTERVASLDGSILIALDSPETCERYG